MIHWFIILINVCFYAYKGDSFIEFDRCVAFAFIGFIEFTVELLVIVSIFDKRSIK